MIASSLLVLLLFFVSSLSALVPATNQSYSVTHEAVFEIEVRNFHGVGEDYRGIVKVALFGISSPVTVTNFVGLTNGFKLKTGKIHYKGKRFHRVIPDFIVQGGDVSVADGREGLSIYGEKFNDEPFIHSHRSAGWVAMANKGKDTNASQFYFTLARTRWLDNKHVVFGKVIKGYDVIRLLGELETHEGSSTPKLSVVISDCVAKKLKKVWIMKKDQLDQTEDF